MPAGRWKTEAITLMGLMKECWKQDKSKPSSTSKQGKCKTGIKTKNKTNKDLVTTHKLNTYQETNKEQIQKNKTHEYLTFKLKQEVT